MKGRTMGDFREERDARRKHWEDAARKAFEYRSDLDGKLRRAVLEGMENVYCSEWAQCKAFVLLENDLKVCAGYDLEAKIAKETIGLF